jgi:hypothetical protein
VHWSAPPRATSPSQPALSPPLRRSPDRAAAWLAAQLQPNTDLTTTAAPQRTAPSFLTLARTPHTHPSQVIHLINNLLLYTTNRPFQKLSNTHTYTHSRDANVQITHKHTSTAHHTRTLNSMQHCSRRMPGTWGRQAAIAIATTLGHYLCT